MTPARFALLALLWLLGWFLFPQFVAAFAPPPEFPGDFLQDWVTAKNVRAGGPPYEPIAIALKRHPGVEFTHENILGGNAHPPATIPLVLPFAWLSYPDARLVWNTITFALFAVAVVFLLRELGAGRNAALYAVPLAIICDPLRYQLALANFNCLFAALLVAAWLADRRDRQYLAGAAVGAIAAFKLFPLFMLIYFVAARRWKAVVATGIVFVALNLMAVAVVGADTFRVYAQDVAPTVAAENASSWMNISATGFWMRAFAPTPSHRIEPLVFSPLAGKALSLTSQAIIAALALWAALKRDSQSARDRGFAVVTAGMVLASPISWPISFLLLLVPLGLLFRDLAGRGRIVLWAAVVFMWLPLNYAAQLFLGPGQAANLLMDKHDPLSAAQNLGVASLGVYAAAAALALTVRLQRPNPV